MAQQPLRLVPVALLSLLAACGGGNGGPTNTPLPSPTAPPVTTPPAPSRTVVLSDSFSLTGGSSTFKNVDLPPPGTIDATVDWSGSVAVDLYATDNGCASFSALRNGKCTILAKADGGAKPGRVSFATPGGKVYTFWIANPATGGGSVSGTLEVGSTRDPNAPIPTPPPTPVPGASPSPPGDPRDGLAAGPVVQFRIKVRSIDRGGFDYRDPEEDASGNWIVHPGEFVVFDSTQKNAAGDLCKWVNDPEWFLEDPDEVVHLRDSSQPFLLRTDILKKGTFKVRAKIDGVDSNALQLVSEKH